MKPSWFSPLHIAVKRGLEQTVEFLLQQGADVNAVASDDLMPLTMAENLELSVPGRSSIIEALLKRYILRLIRYSYLTNLP